MCIGQVYISWMCINWTCINFIKQHTMTNSQSSTAAGSPRLAPLTGIRVLDLSRVLAGPFCTQNLADLGADVIKVERPKLGDDTRAWAPPYLKDAEGHDTTEAAYYLSTNRNKRSIEIDLASEAGIKLVKELAKHCDILVENFKVGGLKQYGLDYESMKEAYPSLIYCSITGFGQTGPYAHRPAFGTNIESIAGIPQLMGDPNGPPTMATFALGDYLAGLTMMGAISMALYHRDANGGTGQQIDAAILAPLLMLMTRPIMNFDQLGVLETRRGNRSTGTAPRRAFRTKDGKWVNIAAATAETAKRIMHMVGRPEIAEEPWFKSNGERLVHADLIDGAIEEWIGAKMRDDIMRIAEQMEVTLAPMNDVEEMFNDIHIRQAGFITAVDDPELGPMNMPNVLFRMSGTPGQIRWTGPKLGEATKAILEDELGIPSARLEALRRRKVIF